MRDGMLYGWPCCERVWVVSAVLLLVLLSAPAAVRVTGLATRLTLAGSGRRWLREGGEGCEMACCTVGRVASVCGSCRPSSYLFC